MEKVRADCRESDLSLEERLVARARRESLETADPDNRYGDVAEYASGGNWNRL